MVAAVVLDVIVLVILVVLLIQGFRGGLTHSVGSILGLAVGGAAAYFLMPLITSLLPGPAWRLVLIVGSAVLLLVAGRALGAAAGRAISGRQRTGPGGISRIGGAALSLAIGALTISLVGGGVARLGAPIVSQAAQQSQVLRTLEQLTPDPVDTALAGLRASILAAGLGSIDEPLLESATPVNDDPDPAVPGAPSPPPLPAPVGTSTGAGTTGYDLTSPADATAAIVRISGSAYSCGMDFTGTGVVIAADRIVTNAHVVAGVEQPLIATAAGESLAGRVVYFDPEADLAVIATEGMTAPVLSLGQALDPGERAAAGGYPFGGPYVSTRVEVSSRSAARVQNIYRSAVVERDIYVLSGSLSPGQSGGPVLDAEGDLVGLLFGRAADGSATGYALTPRELAPVIAEATGRSQRVSTAGCPALAF